MFQVNISTWNVFFLHPDPSERKQDILSFCVKIIIKFPILKCGSRKFKNVFSFFLQEDEIVPTIYSGLSEDDRFIGKLLAAQNFMVNIQNEVTKLVQDYMRIRQKDRKLRIKNEQKQIKRKTPANFPHHNYPQQQPPSHCKSKSPKKIAFSRKKS